MAEHRLRGRREEVKFREDTPGSGSREPQLRKLRAQIDDRETGSNRAPKRRRRRLWGKPVEVEYAPWRETAEALSPERIVIAEMLFYTTLMKKARKEARKKRRSLRTFEPDGSQYKADNRRIRRGKDRKQYVRGLLSAYEAELNGTSVTTDARDVLGRTQTDYAQKIQEMKLEAERNKIYTYVKSLNDTDFEEAEKKVRRNTQTFINKILRPLSKEQKNFMELHTGITPKEALKGWLITAGLTAVTLAILEGGSFIGGRETVRNNLVDSLNNSLANLDLKFDLRTGLLVASYMIWLGGVIASTVGNYKLLKETGYSTNIVSKGLYDYVSARTDSGTIKYLASAIGYSLKDIAAEAPWVAGVIIAPQVSSVTPVESIDFLIGANVTAGVLEGGLGVITASRARRRKKMISRKEQTS